MEDLRSAAQRIVYLVTYSRADTERFPTKRSFAEAVLEGWHNNGYRVLHWVASIEGHADAEADSGSLNINRYHYHMALKLAKRGRWLQVRKYLDDTFGIQVNFSDNHNSYHSAYQYVTKEDAQPLHSPLHPDLSSGVPRTETAIASKKRKASEKDAKNKRKGRKEKRSRLSIYDVTQIIQAKKITSRLQLVCLAVEQNRQGKTALAEFIANKGNKAVDEALSIAKEFAEAEAKCARSKKTRLELLQEMREAECCDGCQGRWLAAALQVLRSNGIMVSAFCNALYNALDKGRGKYQNVFIHGPANSAKTFILSPLKCIYRTFCNPATGSFAWMGAEEAEVIFLNDFRWSPTIIAWADLLQALEGDTVHLPAPKNFCQRDIELSSDTPFFATADAPLVLIKGGNIDRANTEMMEVRWRFFHFWKQIPESQQLRLKPCGHCFAMFVLQNVDM